MHAIGHESYMRLAVSVVIYEDPSRLRPDERPSGRVLAVRRPEEARESFGGMWGLPAATVGQGETAAAAVRRLGSQKLGMTLEAVGELARGKRDRPDGLLSMVLFEARAKEREPVLARSGQADGVTYYTEWKWAEADAFAPTAAAGSLCCQLYLERTVDGG